jgi:hypothetical protein
MNPSRATRTDAAVPPPPEALRRLLDGELSLYSRLGYVALLLVAAMMTALVTILWVTEPALPVRTQAGFAVMILIGLSWMGFSAWVLKHRRPLLAGHSIVASRMAVVFTSLFVIGALAVGQTSGGAAAYPAALTGVVMLGVAIVLLVRARHTFARLMERRATLERELGRG